MASLHASAAGSGPPGVAPSNLNSSAQHQPPQPQGPNQTTAHNHGQAEGTNGDDAGTQPSAWELELRSYALAVAAHSEMSNEHSLYPGEHYRNLAAYLRRQTYFDPRSAPAESDFFVSLHRFQPAQENARVHHFRNVHHFISESSNIPAPEPQQGSILFLRGHPSPLWLNTIGCKYQVDPEMFQQHMDYRSTMGRPDSFALPTLPSSSCMIPHLNVNTVGCRSYKSWSRNVHAGIEKLRRSDAEAMDQYLHRLGLGSSFKAGDSIVRQFVSHDEKLFSVLQRITMCVVKDGPGWIAIVWLDASRDLGHCPTGPWSSEEQDYNLDPKTSVHGSSHFYPILQHRNRIALRPHLINQSTREGAGLCGPPTMPQSMSLLPISYGTSLDARTAAEDAFYALEEIFTFGAYAETQFINLSQGKIEIELDDARATKDYRARLANLRHCKELLDTHILWLHESLTVIISRGGPKWPRSASADGQRRADKAAAALRRDYQHLAQRADTLASRAGNGITLLLSSAQIAESEKALAQAQRVGRLTLLAFVYIPLSFTTSFFGMNFQQLGTGKLNIWIWFVVSVCVLGLSLGLYYVRVSSLIAKAAAVLGKRKRL